MNKSRSWFFGILSIMLSSCTAKDKAIYGCTAEQSDKVFAGEFEIKDIESIVIIKSNQKSIYPIPDIKNQKGVSYIRSPDFYSNFRKSLVNPENRKQALISGFYPSFHIFVIFHSGSHACLFGRMGSSGFIIEPMFVRDSYAINNNEIHNLIASELYKLKPAIHDKEN